MLREDLRTVRLVALPLSALFKFFKWSAKMGRNRKFYYYDIAIEILESPLHEPTYYVVTLAHGKCNAFAKVRAMAQDLADEIKKQSDFDAKVKFVCRAGDKDPIIAFWERTGKVFGVNGLAPREYV